jgi:hypothetical protein
MNKTLIVLFITLFALHTCSKLVIIGAFYANKKYIAENICENRFNANSNCEGSCYLTSMLEEDDKSELPQSTNKLKEIELYNTSISYQVKKHIEIVLLSIFPKHLSIPLCSGFPFSIFHPPQI